jgi:hypothetical protein
LDAGGGVEKIADFPAQARQSVRIEGQALILDDDLKLILIHSVNFDFHRLSSGLQSVKQAYIACFEIQ